MSAAENPPARSVAPPLNRGKLAVLSILGLALLLAGVAWWVNFQRGRRCLELYGSDAALLIRRAKQVEIVPDAGPAIDISQAPGLINARAALLDDASYQWHLAPPTPGGEVRTIRFTQGNFHVSLQFSRTGQNVFIPESGRTATFDQKTAAGWNAFIDRHVPAEEPMKDSTVKSKPP